MITVYVIDPIAMFRKGIYVALAGDENIEVIGDTADMQEAQRFLKVHSPNIVILHSGESGLKIAKWIVQERPAERVILILDDEDDESLLSAMKSGASAIFTRETCPERLLNLVREVAEGGKPISQFIACCHTAIG